MRERGGRGESCGFYTSIIDNEVAIFTSAVFCTLFSFPLKKSTSISQSPHLSDLLFPPPLNNHQISIFQPLSPTPNPAPTSPHYLLPAHTQVYIPGPPYPHLQPCPCSGSAARDSDACLWCSRGWCSLGRRARSRGCGDGGGTGMVSNRAFIFPPLWGRGGAEKGICSRPILRRNAIR